MEQSEKKLSESQVDVEFLNNLLPGGDFKTWIKGYLYNQRDPFFKIILCSPSLSQPGPVITHNAAQLQHMGAEVAWSIDLCCNPLQVNRSECDGSFLLYRATYGAVTQGQPYGCFVK